MHTQASDCSVVRYNEITILHMQYNEGKKCPTKPAFFQNILKSRQ